MSSFDRPTMPMSRDLRLGRPLPRGSDGGPRSERSSARSNRPHLHPRTFQSVEHPETPRSSILGSPSAIASHVPAKGERQMSDRGLFFRERRSGIVKIFERGVVRF